jgi:hypothetical protein
VGTNDGAGSGLQGLARSGDRRVLAQYTRPMTPRQGGNPFRSPSAIHRSGNRPRAPPAHG